MRDRAIGETSPATMKPTRADVIAALAELIERHSDVAVQVRVLAAAIRYLTEGCKQ